MNDYLDKIINMDCLDGLKNLPNNCIDLVVTDPPYNISGNGGGCFGTREYLTQLTGISNGFSTEILDELVRVMKKINIYLFCSQKQIIPLLDYFVTKRNCNYIFFHGIKQTRFRPVETNI